MDEVFMPAAPSTAQPQANATRSFKSEAGKGMRMAHGKSIVSGNTIFELYQAHVIGTEGCLQRHAEFWWRGYPAFHVASGVKSSSSSSPTMLECGNME
jgi:hypothetical protein